MPHRDGALLRGRHTTVTDLAGKVFDIVSDLGVVTGIALGVIQSGKGVAGASVQRVKIEVSKGCLVLTVRQARSVQELKVYNGNMQFALEKVARSLRDNQIPISFKNRQTENC